MSLLELTRTVTVEVDEVVDLTGLEEAALAFARTAPAQLVSDTVVGLMETLLDAVVGQRGDPIAPECQPEAPWACPRCGSRQGFRRRGFRAKPRKVTAAVGAVAFAAHQVECMAAGCVDKRFAPVCGLLGLAPYQRRTDELSRLAAGLACEVAYAKASALLAGLTGVAVSARTIRNDVVAMAPQRLGPRVVGDIPIVLLDGTGERAGDKKLGVQLRLAIGLVARGRAGRRTIVRAELLAATLDESWDAIGDLLADVHPGLIVVDGEPELDDMLAARFPAVPVQRCLFHLARGMGYAAWTGQVQDPARQHARPPR